jgi:hypothetical protein
LEERIVTKMDHQKLRMKSLARKVDNMEDMLQQLLSLSKRKQKAKAVGGVSVSRREREDEVEELPDTSDA